MPELKLEYDCCSPISPLGEKKPYIVHGCRSTKLWGLRGPVQGSEPVPSPMPSIDANPSTPHPELPKADTMPKLTLKRDQLTCPLPSFSIFQSLALELQLEFSIANWRDKVLRAGPEKSCSSRFPPQWQKPRSVVGRDAQRTFSSTIRAAENSLECSASARAALP